jgi:DNA mismatch repair protein MutS
VINRAKQILKSLEDSDVTKATPQPKNRILKHENPYNDEQMGLMSFADNEVINILKSLDVTTLTPIEAINLLYELNKKAKNY